MKSRSGPMRGRVAGLVSSVLSACVLAVGCGESDEGGTAEYRQKFEKPAAAPAPPKEKPDTTKAGKELSPRERRGEKGAG